MSPASGTVLAVLREPDFRRFFIGQSASLLGDGIVGVALAFAVLDLTGSPADLGYVLAARSISLVAGLLVGGVIADRLPRRRIMVTADLARFARPGNDGRFVDQRSCGDLELAVLQVLHGTASAVFNPASTGLVPAVVTGPHLQQTNALRGLAMSVGRIGGPVLAGFLVAMASPGWAIAADAATFAISAITLTRVRPPAHRPAPAQPFLRDLRDGWAEFSSTGPGSGRSSPQPRSPTCCSRPSTCSDRRPPRGRPAGPRHGPPSRPWSARGRCSVASPHCAPTRAARYRPGCSPSLSAHCPSSVSPRTSPSFWSPDSLFSTASG